MAFYGANFIYDNIISSEYGLTITSTSSGEEESTDGAGVKLYTQEIYRRPRSYLLGVQQSPSLTFSVELNVSQELSAEEDSVISNWLFGSMNYKKLQILQPDMTYVYYNAIFDSKQTYRVGNIIRGYTANVVCDSPFAWEFPKSEVHDYGLNTYWVQDNIIINNKSDNADYTYPKVIFKMNAFGGDISIVNQSDGNRNFAFTGLNAFEQITVDNDLQTIVSSISEDTNRLPNFNNYNWMRLVKNVNKLYLTGNIEKITFEYQFAKKVS